MKTLSLIVQKAGGWRPNLYLKIQNPPFMELVIEAMDESGPLGLPAVSVGHYGRQNGDAMRDPEMCFELQMGDTLQWNPFYWRNDYVGIEQWSREFVNGTYYEDLDEHTQHRAFAATWDTNLRMQGYADAFTDKCILG